jgi:CheY-like chemotaxis protein
MSAFPHDASGKDEMNPTQDDETHPLHQGQSGDRARPATRQETILVIDNDPESLELMARFLQREGFQAARAEGGEEGLRRARELRPLAITLDLRMPGMDGWDVLHALKADPELALIPVIIISISDERSKGFALGAADFLIKPVERARVVASLKKLPRRPPDGAVLVVEDDPDNREVLVRLLRKEGWLVTEASNGQEALQRMSEAVPRLIVLDLMMPVMDGFAFVGELAKTPAFRAIPIVAVTARDLSAEDREHLGGSIGKVLRKGSYTRDELLREVRNRAVRPGE